MTVFSVTLAVTGSTSGSPTTVTQDITSTDTISATINTSIAAFTDWFIYTGTTGCTISPTSGVRGSIATITPTAGATSYTANFVTERTVKDGGIVQQYGSITGTITPVTPTYSVANASTNEGASATVNVTTTNVANATTLYWTVNATTADVTAISGSFTITSNAGSFSIAAIADSLTEGTETYTISVRTGSTAGTVVATSTLTINDTSVAADTTPDAFTFTDITGATASTVYTTSTTVVTGLEPNYSITITASGGTVDAGVANLSGTFAASKTVTTSSTGSIVIAARVTSSATAGAQVNCVVTVGTLSDTFSVTTYSGGTQVNSFTLNDISNASFSTAYTSNTITIGGLNTGLTGTVTVAPAGTTYSKNGLAFTSSTGSVTNGDTLAVRVTSSANYSTSVTGTLYVTTGSNLVFENFVVTTFNFIYSLTPNFISIYEGGSIPLVLETTGVANGTVLYWTLNATTADFSAINGSFTINSNTGTFNITALSDVLTEGTETYTLSVRSGSITGTVLTTSTVLINDPPANAYGMQIFDANGNLAMDTNTYTVKEVKYAVSVTAPTTISVESITADTVPQVLDLSTEDSAAIGSVTLDYINKLLIVSGGSSFLATISLMDYR